MNIHFSKGVVYFPRGKGKYSVDQASEVSYAKQPMSSSMCCIFWSHTFALAAKAHGEPRYLIWLAQMHDGHNTPNVMQSSVQIRGQAMFHSSKASFHRERFLSTNLSNSSKALRGTMLVLVICALWLMTDSSNGQASSNAATSPVPTAKICDGEVPSQKATNQARQPGVSGINAVVSTTSDEPQTGSDVAKNHLKLSMKAASEGTSSSQGQFCSRERASETPAKPSAGSASSEESTQPGQSAAPSPIALVTGGGLIIRANGQDFASVLNAIRSVTGITVEMPNESESEPVFMNLGPVSTKDALMALLEGTRYNYVIVGSQGNSQVVKRLIVSSRSSAAAPPLVASASQGPATPQLEAYGGQGFHEDAEAQNAEPPPPAQPPAPTAVVPSSVPTGINIQQLAAQSNKTPGQILDELQKHQQQVLDDQAASQPQ